MSLKTLRLILNYADSNSCKVRLRAEWVLHWIKTAGYEHGCYILLSLVFLLRGRMGTGRVEYSIHFVHIQQFLSNATLTLTERWVWCLTFCTRFIRRRQICSTPVWKWTQGEWRCIIVRVLIKLIVGEGRKEGSFVLHAGCGEYDINNCGSRQSYAWTTLLIMLIQCMSV